jgi:hypothetical protein
MPSARIYGFGVLQSSHIGVSELGTVFWNEITALLDP